MESENLEQQLETKQIELAQFKEEFEEYREQAKELEEELEYEVKQQDSKINDLSNKYEEVKENLTDFKKKYLKNEKEVAGLQNQYESVQSELNRHHQQKRELEQLNDQWENSARILEFYKQDLEERLYQAEENCILYKEELDEVAQSKEEEIQRLKDEWNDLKTELTIIQSNSDNSEKCKEEISAMQRQLDLAIIEKRNLEEELITRQTKPEEAKAGDDIPQTIRVLSRIRPLLSGEENMEICVKSVPTEISVLVKGSSLSKRTTVKKFKFDKVFQPSSTNDEVFNVVADSIEQATRGNNACVMAYGQTGSGKTFTMSHLISASVYQISKTIALMQSGCTISLNFVEIYNEKVRSLMGDGDYIPLKDALTSSEIKLAEWNEAEVLELVETAVNNRCTKFTEQNEVSSRSHFIFQLTFSRAGSNGRIQFVDLAGSERMNKSNCKGDVLKETLAINRSLSALQDVMTALENKSSHVPYRNSVLTRMLQPTLSRHDSIVTMIFMVSPIEASCGETISTLSLGVRLKAVELGGGVQKQIETQEVERTLKLLEKEREEKNSILRKLEKLERDLTAYQFSIKEKDNKISTLTGRIKQKEKEWYDELERLRRENKDIKNKHELANKQLRMANRKNEQANAKRKNIPKAVSCGADKGYTPGQRKPVVSRVAQYMRPNSAMNRTKIPMPAPSPQKEVRRPNSAAPAPKPNSNIPTTKGPSPSWKK